MLNDVLCNPGTYANRIPICVCPLCILGNKAVSECYIGFKLGCAAQLYSQEIAELAL